MCSIMIFCRGLRVNGLNNDSFLKAATFMNAIGASDGVKGI
ncbi:MAG: hypothetical protein JWQ69_343 [Pseudomonas sp.]|nr:hypothetical protein [Pseudomonas sp.]